MPTARNFQFVFEAADMILDCGDHPEREFAGFQIRQGNVDFHFVGHRDHSTAGKGSSSSPDGKLFV
jgi:hypothetical protein